MSPGRRANVMCGNSKILAACIPASHGRKPVRFGPIITFALRLVLGSLFIFVWQVRTHAQNLATTLTSAPQLCWQAVASSADGTKLVAVANGGSYGALYTSSDSSRTWISNSAPSL